MTAKSNPNEIHITRVYDAPVELVWDAWTDPAQAAQWWGPRGFTITTHSKDLRPGGIWHYTMHGPDGVDYPNKTLYHEVEEHHKLVYDHGGYDERAPLFRVTVLFIASGDKTTMEMTMTLPSAEEAEAARKFIKQAGGNATWDRLAEYLGKHSGRGDCFVINRSFQAPPERVFAMWADAEHLPHWLPPAGFEMEFLQADIRSSGSSFFRMTNRADVTFYGRMEYQEVVPPSRLVYLQQFCDEQGNVGRHPKMPVWPPTMRLTILFVAEETNATRVTVTCEPFGKTTAEEIRVFLEARPGMTLGWTGSFDKLETALAKQESARPVGSA